jgi:uncharacterized repeat protein (TIGR01451 family)
MKKLGGWGIGACALLGFAMAACGSSSQNEDEGVLATTALAVSGADNLELYVYAPESGAVGAPMYLGSTVWWNGQGPESSVSDVSLTTTVLGSFDPQQIGSHSGLFACAKAEPVPGGIAVTCHADEWLPWFKDGSSLQIVPTAADSIITTSATLSVGGVELKSESRKTPILADAGADLAVFGWGGGTAMAGEPTFTSFFASNYGPGTATNAEVSLVLTGSGAFSSVSAWPGNCTVTDTTASCTLGDLYPWWGTPIDVVFVGNEPGQVAITASVSAETSDPVPYNDSTTSYFEVVKPKRADLEISISDAPDPVKINGLLTYSIIVKNNGPDTASEPVVYDWLQPNLTLVSVNSSQGYCYGDWWGSVSCWLGALAAGETASIEIAVTPTEAGTITNYVSVDNWSGWNELDPNYENNHALAETTVKGPNPPVVTTASQSRYPVTFGAYVPCADDFVLLEGTLHGSFHTLYNKKSGRYQYESLFNPQGISGKGLGSGETYHATGMTREASKWTAGFPASYTYQNNFRIIGQKTGNNLLVHATTHVSFGPDGSVKTSVTNYSFDCK